MAEFLQFSRDRAVLFALLAAALGPFGLPPASADVLVLKDGRRMAGALEEKRDRWIVELPDGPYEIFKTEVDRVVRDPVEIRGEAARSLESAQDGLRTAERLSVPLDRNRVLRRARDSFAEAQVLYYDVWDKVAASDRLGIEAEMRRATEGIKSCRDRMVLSDARTALAVAKPTPAAPAAGPREKPKPPSSGQPPEAPQAPSEPAEAPPEGAAGTPEGATGTSEAPSRPPVAYLRPLSVLVEDLKKDAATALLAADEIALQPKASVASHVVRRLVAEQDPVLREALKDCLGKFRYYAVLNPLKEQLRNKDLPETVLQDALDVLAIFRREETTLVAVQMYLASGGETEQRALERLIELGEMAVKPLADKTRKVPSVQAQKAIRALGAIATPSAVSALVYLVAWGGPPELYRLGTTVEDRDLAMQTLRGLGTKSVPALIIALEDTRRRQLACELLQEITGESFGPRDIHAWKLWWKSEQAAAEKNQKEKP